MSAALSRDERNSRKNAQLAAYVQNVLAEAPPLTQEQRDKLSGLLRGRPYEDRIRAAVEAFPPFTDDQVDRLSTLLNNGDSTAEKDQWDV